MRKQVLTKGWWELAGRFVDGLKAAGAGFFAGVPVKFRCGSPFGIPDVARPPRPFRKGEDALATACLATTFCINELYQKGRKSDA